MSGLLLIALLGAAPDLAAQKAKATELLGKRAWAEACQLFARVTAAAPTDAEAWAGLGACRAAQQRKREAISAALTAVRLGEAKDRLSAYVSLSIAGVERRLPSPQPDDEAPRCVPIASAAPCATKVLVCTSVEVIDSEETRDVISQARVGFGLTEAEASANRAKNAFSHSALHGSEGVQTECVLVFVDGCKKRAGVVCTTATSGQAGAATEAREIDF